MVEVFLDEKNKSRSSAAAKFKTSINPLKFYSGKYSVMKPESSKSNLAVI